MKSLVCIMVLFFSIPEFSGAQTSSDILSKLQEENKNGGMVKIIQSESIRNVLLLHLATQRKSIRNNGYRICIFADSGQEANRQAEHVRSVFMSIYRDVRPYKTFNYPFYRVYVGDFKTKSEALKFLKTLERNFPNAYIVSDVVSQSVLM
ncbi:MAG: SPOR domain-containing protein [Bacteroidales bacterium]|nr:SPOR domain-containing protein [Bacteroidales bacterium]